MAKKILAAMLALTMCASLASCGKNSGNSENEKSSRSANTTTKEDDTASEDNTSSTEDKKMKLTDLSSENILYRDYTDADSDKPAMEESLMFAEIALEQYSAAQSGDAEKYTQTLNLKKNLDSMAESVMNIDEA